MPNNIVSFGSGLLDHSMFGKVQGPIASLIMKQTGIETPEEALWNKVFREKKSKHFAENYVSRTGLADMEPVPEGGDYPSTAYQDGYDKMIVNEEFKQSFTVTMKAIEDDVYGTVKDDAKALVTSYKRGKARLAARFVGESLQGKTEFVRNGVKFNLRCMDGGGVFSTAHAPKVSGAAQCNLFSDAFSVDVLTAGMLRMRSIKDEDNNTLDITPDTIIIPSNRPVLYNAVMQAVAAMGKPGTANNDVNIHHGNFTVLVSSYLNDWITAGTSPWILFDSVFNQAADGNIFQDRVPFGVRSELERNDNNVWLARARYNFGFVNWRQMMAFGVPEGNAL